MSTATPDATPETAASPEAQLERGTYEIIRNRLSQHGRELRARLDRLNNARREVFGSIETKLLATERVTTENNCTPRDIAAIGEKFLFGYNVHMGLRSETHLSDVFAAYELRDGGFHELPLDLIANERFATDFEQLYKYYRDARFAKFFRRGPQLYMKFHVGKTADDFKAFKWLQEGDRLTYVDNRSDFEVTYPPQHEFEWRRTHRDLHRGGEHPHVSVEDRVFVETVGGDLTIKIEDNTDSGEGIYAEPVDNPDQTLDDAEIFYATLDNIILLKIRPYQERDFRYIVYNEKIQAAQRIDAIHDACVLLPEGHGLIFSNGYYLQSGEYKTFESELSDLKFERRLAAPNGEDYLYVFYNRESGINVLLSYNVIEQRVDTPVVCHGFSVFPNGHMVLFRADREPQRHHALQIWQTPFVGPDYQQHEETDSFLYKIGNKDIVRGMAECHEVLGLIEKDEAYADLYIDIVKKTTAILDAYYWLDNEETFRLNETLAEVRSAASAAVEEFEKVLRVRRNTREQFDRVAAETRQITSQVYSRRFDTISDFVSSLADLRRVRGDLIGLRELKYIDLAAVEGLEGEVSQQADKLAQRCVEFLLRDDALAPYEKRVERQRGGIEGLDKVAEAKQLEAEITDTAAELEMLIDVVSNLKIDDATQRTAIIDNISAIYSQLNQARAALKKKTRELLCVEGVAEFNSQMKLLGQAVVNYLDVSDTPERCDEYLTKLMVQIEELEGRFAEFDEFVLQLTEKREEVYSAFDARKLALVEARNKRAAALMSAADRILSGIATRVGNLEEINEIHSYFAADLMIEKVRDICRQLTELEDSVKVDDIQSRLKTIREDAIRQLKDRKELYEEGENVIRLGRHKFSVNVQPLDLTTVLKDGELSYHLTGTKFLEPITEPEILDLRDVWQQEHVSESRQVYRGEYLAWQMFKAIDDPADDALPAADELLGLEDQQLTARVQQFMSPRYAEGYVKGVHDHDAAQILRGLLEIASGVGLLRYESPARALASVYWSQLGAEEHRALRDQLAAKLAGMGAIAELFATATGGRDDYIAELESHLREFARQTRLFDEPLARPAAEYLFAEQAGDGKFSLSAAAAKLCRDFRGHLQRRNFEDRFNNSLAELEGDTPAVYRLLRNWVAAFAAEHEDGAAVPYVDEAAAALLDDSVEDRHLLHGSATRDIEGLVGDHPVIEGGTYLLDFNEFTARLRQYEQHGAPRFVRFQQLKKELADHKREELRLEEFKPRVLSSFVRNRLIDEVYLPMVGDNLAKQVGVVGEGKRTDLMGLLLLISPPGYGKTTLMEYIANRLGITFMKINGPAIGHAVTSLDPAEAPNASAREEIEKLNLSLEMGDNVMIYLDDIQHCNPEFLQKFISLCDAQRKIEGVYRGRTRTYDLRGRKVAVVMAGNPYTESGEKFQIPDMLTNRADTYNLGDVIGDNAESFEMSYLENSLTSNPALAKLASRSQHDVRAVIRMAAADAPEGIELEGSYSVEELNELTGVMRKLIRARDVLLTVNEMYIRSAAQADEYRTEPPFKLQGSYRDMNKIAERVLPIMNEAELETLIMSHYENQAQTLTTGAEANLLKLRELLGKLTEEQAQRWEDIKRTFKRNLLLGSAGGEDKFGQVIAQITTVTEGLESIKAAIGEGVARLATEDRGAASPSDEHLPAAVAALGGFGEQLAAIKDALSAGVERLENVAAADSGRGPEKHKVHVTNKVPRAFLDVIQAQFQLLQGWMQALVRLTGDGPPDAEGLREAVGETFEKYQSLIEKMELGRE